MPSLDISPKLGDPGFLDLVRNSIGYDPKTGRFWWKVKPSKNRAAGDPAGCIVESGYHIIVIGKRSFRAHQLAWLIMTGEWPSDQIDHRNKKRADNRWRNLRLANGVQNRANTGVRRHNKGGVKGVQMDGRRWRARISIDGKTKWLGSFASPSDAHEAYMSAARERYGEFARGK